MITLFVTRWQLDGRRLCGGINDRSDAPERRQRSGEDGATLRAVRSSEIAAVRPQDAARDCQPQTRAATLPIARGVAAI